MGGYQHSFTTASEYSDMSWCVYKSGLYISTRINNFKATVPLRMDGQLAEKKAEH